MMTQSTRIVGQDLGKMLPKCRHGCYDPDGNGVARYCTLCTPPQEETLAGPDFSEQRTLVIFKYLLGKSAEDRADFDQECAMVLAAEKPTDPGLAYVLFRNLAVNFLREKKKHKRLVSLDRLEGQE
jgi:hypothetical protein